MSKQLRAGVVGLGRIGWEYHCRHIARHRNFKLVAVCDPAAERVTEAVDSFGCTGYADISSLLGGSDLDVITIASPTHLHKEQAVQSLRNGCHVLLEKPMAMNPSEAASIVRASRRYERTITVFQPWRARAVHQHLKRIILSGKLGKLVSIRIGSYNFVQRNDWQSLTKFGGGMLNNYGAHIMDRLLDLIGSDIKRVFCRLRCVATLGDAEDVVKVVCETDDGVIGEAEINQASAISFNQIEVTGTLGALVSDGKVFHLRYVRGGKLPAKKLNRSLTAEDRKYPSDKIAFVEKEIPVNQNYALDYYTNFYNAVCKGKELLVKPDESLKLMQILADARKNANRIVR